MKSIRTNLVVTVLSVMTLTVFLSSLRGYQSSIEKAQDIFDEQLQGVAKLLLETDHSAPDTVNPPVLQSYIYQIFSATGEKLLASNAGIEVIAPLREGFSYHNAFAYRWRVFVHQDPLTRRWVCVGERADLRFSLAENIVIESIIPVVLSLPIAAVLIWWLIGSGLSNLNRVAKDLAVKQIDDLQPLHYKQTPSELVSLVGSVNALFKRLDGAFQRERHFSSDAAHELRTPISALKVNLYNLRQQEGTDVSLLVSLESDLARLEHIVEQTLLLYRTAPESFSLQLNRVDLAAILREQVSVLYQQFEAKQQTISLAELPQCWVLGNANFLSILIANLLSNANKYTPSKGCVKGQLRLGENYVELAIQDSGAGIAEHDFERVFDRFYRVGADRHSSGVIGCGLGLAISKHIADLHSASIGFTHLSNTDAMSFEVSVRFALAPRQV